MTRHNFFLSAAAIALLCTFGLVAANLGNSPLIPNLPAVPQLSVSTVPSNGDINPYGVAFVPPGFPKGSIQAGDILVSNFNNSTNAQGTGTTIVAIRGGSQSLFFHGPMGLGLTTALGVLKKGFVLVGNLPSTGTCTDPGHVGVGQGSLIILNAQGQQVANLMDSNLLDGPWDLTVDDRVDTATVYVSSVLNGVVTRINLSVPNAGSGSPMVTSMTQIGSGYAHRCDPGALVVGPTGLALDRGVLFVASAGDNTIFGIDNAASIGTTSGTGRVVYQDSAHLRGPVGLILAPNGDLVATNGDAVNPDPTQQSEMVEFTTGGQFVAQRSVDNSAPGGAFGLAVSGNGANVTFAAVDDVTNVLDVWMGH